MKVKSISWGGPQPASATPPGTSSVIEVGAWLTLTVIFLHLSGCVYFNTYYNAQRYFRQAEKARKKLEEGRPLAAGPRQGGGRQAGAARGRGGAKNPNVLYDKAARKASVILEKYRDSDLVDDAMFLLGRAFYWQGDYRDAARSFTDLEGNFPASEYFTRAQYWKGLSFEAQGIFGEASSIYRTLVSSVGGQVGAKAGLRLGEIAFQQEQYGTAIQEYESVLDAFPSSATRAELWLRLGEACVALEDTSLLVKASAAFAQVLEESPSDPIEYRARLNRGRLLYEIGQTEDARATYSGLIRDGRFRAFEGETRLLVGQYFSDQGRPQEALDEFTKVRDDFPQTDASAMAIYHTGLVYLTHYSDRARAQEYFESVGEEKRGSEALRLTKETLADLVEVDRLLAEIHRADSLDALEVDLPQEALADTVVGAGESASPESNGAVASDAPGDPSVSAEDASATAGSRATTAAGRRSKRDKQDPREELDETLLSVAELYRDRLTMPDSAIYYYRDFTRRFPESLQVPRALYSIAWIQLEMMNDEAAAGPALEQLITQYPHTAHANAARDVLGHPAVVTAEDQATRELDEIDAIRLASIESPDIYLPQLDALAARYGDTEAGARASWLAAWTYENIHGDTTEAERRFSEIADRFPESPIGDLSKERQKSRDEGLLDKLERALRTLNSGVKPGERIFAIAVEPDTADSVLLARKYLGFALRAHRRDAQETAKEFYELCLEQRQRSPIALFGLGELSWEQGYYDDAMEYYREALRFDQRMIGIHYRLFATHAQSGRADSANHYLREILRRDRDNPDIASLRDQFPMQWGAEPEDLEISTLEEIELMPSKDRFDAPPSSLPLSELPMVRSSVLPEFPEGATLDSAEVVLDILVSEEGLPAAVEIFAGEEPLAAAAAAAARQYVFYPAEGNDGEKTDVWVEIVMPFAPPQDAAEAVRPEEETDVAATQLGSATPDQTAESPSVQDRADKSRTEAIRSDSVAGPSLDDKPGETPVQSE